VRRFRLALLLCSIFFFFPFQVYLIGDGIGIGIQAAVFRYQITSYGNILIPITTDLMYIVNSVFSGKTGFSVIIWIIGTIILTCTVIYSLIHLQQSTLQLHKQILVGLTVTCVVYLVSCIVQYGLLLHGPAGVSIPIGILILLLWIIIVKRYPEIFEKIF